MTKVCPECLRSIPENKKLPYVCVCTRAIYTTGQEWIVPRKKQRKSDIREKKDVRARDSQQLLEEKHRRLWRALHLHRDHNQDWYKAWRDQVTKTTCKCAKHFLGLENSHPIRFNSDEAFFKSSIDMHNAVNERLGKAKCSIERAYTLWRHKRPATQSRRCIVSIAVGYEMIGISKLTWPLMQAYAERCGADFIGLDNQTEDWWGLEKFRTGHFASQYDETLFLDADCVVREQAPSIFDDHPESIGICDESSKFEEKNRVWMTNERRSVESSSKVKIEDTERSVNSGVVFCRRSASGIWLRPKVDIGTMHCAEQIWVGKQIDDLVALGASLKNLDYRWNWQYWYSDFAAGLDQAYIVHFSSANRRLEAIRDYVAKEKTAN